MTSALVIADAFCSDWYIGPWTDAQRAPTRASDASCW